jgi:hypothetical protein
MPPLAIEWAASLYWDIRMRVQWVSENVTGEQVHQDGTLFMISA